MSTVITKTELPFKVFTRGKVRDVYDLGAELLIVASDRISAFDVVLPSAIPDKGKILTKTSVFWFSKLSSIVSHHLIEANVAKLPEKFSAFQEILADRFMLVKKTQKFPIECVVRGFLAGSGWKEYKKDGTVCGIRLPDGLKESDRLPEPIFTPATKEEGGKHDENISFEEMTKRVGKKHAEELRRISFNIFKFATDWADQRGLILADTKFEFGIFDNDKIILIDEVLTSDSSRYWDKKSWTPGRSQDPIDKQFVRDYLESIHWNKKPPAPDLPEKVVTSTRERYIQAYERLTQEVYEK